MEQRQSACLCDYAQSKHILSEEKYRKIDPKIPIRSENLEKSTKAIVAIPGVATGITTLQNPLALDNVQL